jgi:hypothetical protein
VIDQTAPADTAPVNVWAQDILDRLLSRDA